jgi:hypothetical protein
MEFHNPTAPTHRKGGSGPDQGCGDRHSAQEIKDAFARLDAINPTKPKAGGEQQKAGPTRHLKPF